MHALVPKIYSDKVVSKWRLFESVFPPSRVQHVSDLHSKFA